jgi:hypothetical protein
MTTPVTMTADELNAKATDLLPNLRDELGDLSTDISDAHLLKFLRWKPDVKRAAGRFHAHLEWKQKNPGLFDDSLRITKDKELERLLQTDVLVAPPQCRTKVGGPLLIGRLRNYDMKDGRTPNDVCRMFFYNLDRVLEDPEAQLHGVTIVHDLRGFDNTKNVHIEIPKTLFRGIIGHFPIRIRAIYFLDAPWSFGAFFSVFSKLFFPAKVRERCHFVMDRSEIYNDIDQSMLIKDLGGDVEFDSSAWVEEQKEREINDTLFSMTNMATI